MKATVPSKPILPHISFLDKLDRMRDGLLAHKDQKSTTANLVKIFRDRIVTTMRSKEARPLRDKFAFLFVHADEGIAGLARTCLYKAIEELRLPEKVRNEFKGLLANALYANEYRENPNITTMLNAIEPQGWQPPQSKKKPTTVVKKAEEALAA